MMKSKQGDLWVELGAPLDWVVMEGLSEEVTVKWRAHWKDRARDAKLWEKHLRQKDLLVQKFKVGFPGGTVVKNPPANAGDTGSSPGPGRYHMPQSN